MENSSKKGGSGGSAPFRQEKRHVHLMVEPALYKLADIERAKAGISSLSRATELLWEAWSKGKVRIEDDGKR